MTDEANGSTQKLGLTPVDAGQRISSIDTLRGCAVLGILVINVVAFSLPDVCLTFPTAFGDFTGLNKLAWQFSNLFFFQKFMSIFSMLFGGGLILMFERAEKADSDFRKIYYRRILWLLLIAMFHAYLLWHGDILFFYAICGLFIYLFRRFSVKGLILASLIVMLIGLPFQIGTAMGIDWIKNTAIEAEKAQEAGEELKELQQGMLEAWSGMKIQFEPPIEVMEAEIKTYRGSYGDVFWKRLPQVLIMQTFGSIMVIFWRIMTLMLLGMALMKAGFFKGMYSNKRYIITAILAYGIGFPVVWYNMYQQIGVAFDPIFMFRIAGISDFVASVLIALGHISVIMLVCKSGMFRWITERLAAVGRMAFTNYLMQTILMTTLFYGYGFGLFGKLERFSLLGIVLIVWILQLIYSPIWLKHFRFGPAEWLWRSLTYKRKQPMRA